MKMKHKNRKGRGTVLSKPSHTTTSKDNIEVPPACSCKALPDPQAALEHALPHVVVSQVVRPEAAEFLPSAGVKILTLHDSQCCVTALTLISTAQDDLKLTLRFARSLPKLTSVRMLSVRFAEIEDATLRQSPGFQRVLAGAQLTSLHLRDGTWIDDSLSHLSKLPQLTDLDVYNPVRHVDGGHVPEIAKLKQLQHLNVGLCPCENFDNATGSTVYLRSIATLVNLRSISLRSWALKAEGLALVCQLPLLTSLCLSHCRGLMPEDLAPVFSSNRLEELDLSACSGVANEAVAPLFAMPRLRRLNMSDTDITTLVGIPDSSRSLKSQLRELVVSTVHDDELLGITTLHRLRCLKISRFHSKAIAIISQNLTQLRELCLSNSHVHDSSFEPVSALTQLHKISFSSCVVDPMAMRHLSTLKNLRVLHSVESVSCNSVGLLAEVVKLTQLHELTFRSRGGEDLSCLSQLPQLMVLDISCPDDVSCLKHLQDLPQLQVLTIPHGFSAGCAFNSFRDFPKLRSVSFHD